MTRDLFPINLDSQQEAETAKELGNVVINYTREAGDTYREAGRRWLVPHAPDVDSDGVLMPPSRSM